MATKLQDRHGNSLVACATGVAHKRAKTVPSRSRYGQTYLMACATRVADSGGQSCLHDRNERDVVLFDDRVMRNEVPSAKDAVLCQDV